MIGPTSTIGDVMTAARHVVSPNDSLVSAKELMQFHGIRHLPVVDGGRVVGMVTLSDLYVMEGVMEVDPDRTLVASAMSHEAFCVARDSPIGRVAAEMAARKVGSAVVLEDERIVGIFTASDACRVLGQLLGGDAPAR